MFILQKLAQATMLMRIVYKLISLIIWKENWNLPEFLVIFSTHMWEQVFPFHQEHPFLVTNNIKILKSK